MRHYNRPLSLLIIGIISFVGLTCLIYFVSPINPLTISPITNNLPPSLEKYVQISPLIIFFLLLTSFFFSIGSYIFKSKAHGILISGVILAYLLMRLNNLTHPFFLILLLALFFVLELMVSSRK